MGLPRPRILTLGDEVHGLQIVDDPRRHHVEELSSYGIVVSIESE
jgi:hypothetical protein